MGLSLTFLNDLIALKRMGVVGDKPIVAEVGAQQLADNLLLAPQLAELYRLFGRPQIALGEPIGHKDFEIHAPSSENFWRSLGCDYVAIDYGGHRDSISIDLNRDSVPRKLRGVFDLVVNAGTTEHVANQENAFRVVHDLTAARGVMYHEVPSGAYGNHGLFSYNSKFFFLLGRSNRYGFLYENSEPTMIRIAFLKSRLDMFHTPIDLPDGLMRETPAYPSLTSRIRARIALMPTTRRRRKLRREQSGQ